MVTLNAKLNGVEDDKLVGRVVDRWGFFWDQVLTYVEGVLLPLQNDPLLSALYRNRPSSPRRQVTQGSTGLNNAPTPSIDIRTLALRSFRDKIILPLSGRLYTRLAIWVKQEDSPDFPSRLHQMLLVLSAQARSRPPAFSLTAPPPLPAPGETAVNDLLRIVRSPRSMRSHLKARGGQSLKSRDVSPRAPSFLSGGVPRDRRGRIAVKSNAQDTLHSTTRDQGDPSGDETPRTIAAGNLLEMERERGREILDSLRSPDIETAAAYASSGGWGLGAGKVDSSKQTQEEDELLDWDQAQAVVEEMIGMEQATAVQSTASRRRMT
ncbi:hypothetical protein E1B28_009904 [Marasmius oreades]|nr:uncharacterized protein E1B28_009904 [Marasmius oreades]KAG7090820.1 hypothetical protein E1B28_009904 [Marasmius oreades]